MRSMVRAVLLRLRDLEEMMGERRVYVDRATVHRWSLMLPLI